MPPPHPTLAQATRTWARIALLSFGGPAGQIAVMHRILVEEKRWLGDARFLHALNFCMVLPGPEAQQLATYIGWLMHRTRGALIAGGLFILPGLVAMMGLSIIYAWFGTVGIVGGLFFGLKAAVLAIVLQALVRIAGRSLTSAAMRAVAVASFVAIFFLGLPFPLIIVTAALTGLAGARLGWPAFQGGSGTKGPTLIADKDTLLGDDLGPLPQSALCNALVSGVVALGAWAAPVVAIATLASDSVFADIAVFFSQMAVVTFGGAYAALAYVAQEAVGAYGWVQPGEMLDGLGMAETTPGPLIMVLQFVGYLAAFRDAGGMYPVLAGVLGGLLATWVTFAPCFAWIFLGAPFMEGLRANRALSAALTAVTAAVVGVILNLALWFALHVLFGTLVPVALGPIRFDLPVWSTLNPWAAGLSVLALIAVFRFRMGLAPVLCGAAALGIAAHLTGLA
jgi:chromate transporter